MFGFLEKIWSAICLFGLCCVCIGKEECHKVVENVECKFEVLCGALSLPALPTSNGFATSVIEYSDGESMELFRNAIDIIKSVGGGNFTDKLGDFIALFATLDVFFVESFGMSFTALFGTGVVSSVEKVLNDSSFVRMVGHIHPDGIIPNEVNGMSFNVFFERVVIDTANHYGLVRGVFPEEVRNGFAKAMAKTKKENESIHKDKEFTDEEIFSLIVAVDYFYYLIILSGVSEENTIEEIEEHIRKLHVARSKEALEQKIRDTVSGFDICHVTEGVKTILQEILRGTGCVVYGPEQGSLIVVNPKIVTNVDVFPVNIRVNKDKKTEVMTVDPSKNNECTAARAKINGKDVLIFTGHFKSGDVPVAIREKENFNEWYNTYMTDHLEMQHYFGFIDTNIPEGFGLPDLEGVSTCRIEPATSKKRRLFTSQWKKCGKEVLVDYDVGHHASRVGGSGIVHQNIGGNDQLLPNQEHPLDHPIFRWGVVV